MNVGDLGRFVRTYRRIGIALLACVALILVLATWILWWPNTFSDPDERVIYVARGATFRTVLDSLDREGIISSRWTFRMAARFKGGTTSIQFGKYVFRSGLSNTEILEGLTTGSARKLVTVSIPEGWRITAVTKRFGRVLGIDSVLLRSLCYDTTFIRVLGVGVHNLEGYFLPDTYQFHWNTTEDEVIERVVGSLRRFYNDSLKARERQLNMSMHQVLTLASIVEGETRLDSERRTIAGVYHNRLKKRMRLEADPTIQYIITDGPRRILYSDLRTPSPYNTYRYYGLPPGPINNPGRSSILATLYPEQHPYIFFVADGSGAHKFSSTYTEHLRAAREFRRARRAAEERNRANRGSTG